MAFPTSIELASYFGTPYNNLSTTLSAEASASDTTIYVASTDNFDAIGEATCEDEIIYHSGKTAGSFTGCTRGYGNTTPAAHTAGKQVSLTFTAGMWERIVAELRATQTKLGIAGAFNFVPNDGWITTGTMTYASANTITVASGANAIYQKGDKLRFIQSAAWKYFYIIAVADTLLTITAGTDYTVANAAITQAQYSHIENPLNFPHWFNYTPTYSCSGSMTIASVTTVLAKFNIQGKVCKIALDFHGTTGGTASTVIFFTLPVTASETGYTTLAAVLDAGAGKVGIVSVGTTLLGYLTLAIAANWALGATTGAHTGAVLIYGI